MPAKLLFMQKPQNVFGAEKLRTASLGELPDDGLRLIGAFLRIRDPARRAAAIEFVSELAERSEQASEDRVAPLDEYTSIRA
jgi:hypothetical protein